MIHEIEERTLRAMVAAGAELQVELREFKAQQYHLVVKDSSDGELKTYHLSKTQRPGLRSFRSLDRATEFIGKIIPDCAGVRVIRLNDGV